MLKQLQPSNSSDRQSFEHRVASFDVIVEVIFPVMSSSSSYSCLRLPIGIKMRAAPSTRTALGVGLPMLVTWDYSSVSMKMRPEDTVASGRYT